MLSRFRAEAFPCHPSRANKTFFFYIAQEIQFYKLIVSNIIKELIYSKTLLNWDLFCIQIFVEKKFLRFVLDFYLIPYTEVPRFADLSKMFTRSHVLWNLARSFMG